MSPTDVTEEIRLSEVSFGTWFMVRRVLGRRHIRRRLMELGLLPGTEVKVVARSPWGDPIKIRLRDYDLSIRRSEAAEIWVTNR